MDDHKSWQGIGVSTGKAVGRVWRLTPTLFAEAKQTKKDAVDIAREMEHLAVAAELTRRDIARSQEQLRADKGDEYADIFAAHALILDDPSFLPEAEKVIQNGVIAVDAVSQVGEEAAALLEEIEDEYFRERAADVRAVMGQIIRHLLGAGKPFDEAFPVEGSYIVAADELTPAETIALPKQRVLGFLVRKGGKTSHAAILARTYGIPAVLGLAISWEEMETLQYVRLDGDTGIVDVLDETQYLAGSKQQTIEQFDEAEVSPLLQSMTLAANIGSPSELPFAKKFFAQGVGLYRTEFLFMGDSLPNEDDQTEAYRSVIATCAPHTTVIRTLDIGGDKQAPALNLPKEQNPFLGVRALRLCFARPDIFHTQLRAIWRASIAGPTAVMFPMVATVEELRQAKNAFKIARQTVIADGYSVGDVAVGMMIEVPSAALIAKHLAKEVDFFSIGTNDLTQYTLAVDRENSSLNQLNQPYHPAVLQLIVTISQAARAAGIWTGICGEAGGDPILTPFFAALGIDELSMAPGQLPKVRKKLTSLHFDPGEKEELVSSILDCATQDEVRALLSHYGD
ncbi:MAG: phosphoenolpyruvate--protein phosphotransferase [Anaerosporomusa subterranea]|nr:phosphoenolpyruvate--protein phosphotransferase [Anaerosporomusa subterranea]